MKLFSMVQIYPAFYLISCQIGHSSEIINIVKAISTCMDALI